jgi:replicative DNA helicase
MSAAPYDFAPPPDDAPTRVPPHDESAEVAVLSACIQDERALMRAVELVAVGMFYRERHRRIFHALISLGERGTTIDPVTLCDQLERTGELASSGGREYVYRDLMDAIPTTANVEHHAAIVREKFELRQIITLAQAAADEAMSGKVAPSAIAASLQRDVLPLATDMRRQGFVRVKEDVWSVMEEIECTANGGNTGRFVPTGYWEIDTQTSGGFERGTFVVFAGVPGSAKTAVGINIALRMTQADQPIGALFVSAEMTRKSAIKRCLSNLGPIELTKLRKGNLVDDDWPRLAKASGILSNLPLWIDETPTPDIHAIVAKCRQQKAEHPEIGFVLVDFVQLVQKQQAARQMREENRSAELTHISYTLQALAKEIDVAVLATSQVDAAAIEKRPDKRPGLGDARWSQGMREAAHLFATVYRPAMYDGSARDVIELGFQKGRDDPPFRAVFDWHGHHMRMVSQRDYQPQRAVQQNLEVG